MNLNFIPALNEGDIKTFIYTVNDATWTEENLSSKLITIVAWVRKKLLYLENYITDAKLEKFLCFGFFMIGAYVGTCLMRQRMKRLNFHVELLQLHSGSTFIYNAAENCPICLGEFKAPVRTSCGHAFCIFCLLNYFNKNNYQWKCICPLCRNLIQTIECLHKYTFSKRERQKIDKAEKKLIELIERQNSDVSIVHGLVWIRENIWKTALTVFMIFITFIYAAIKSFY